MKTASITPQVITVSAVYLDTTGHLTTLWSLHLPVQSVSVNPSLLTAHVKIRPDAVTVNQTTRVRTVTDALKDTSTFPPVTRSTSVERPNLLGKSSTVSATLQVLKGTPVGQTLAPIHVCANLNSLETIATPALMDISAITANAASVQARVARMGHVMQERVSVRVTPGFRVIHASSARPATSTTHCANFVAVALKALLLRCVIQLVSVCASRSLLVLAVSSVALAPTRTQTAKGALVTPVHLWTPAVASQDSATAGPTTAGPDATSAHQDTTVIPAAYHVSVQRRVLGSVPVI